MQRLEKGKKEQDLLIDHLHGQIKGHQRQIALFTQQHAAQQRETRAAQETLAEAAAEMEGVAFEKQQLTAQWQSSLIAMQKRDEALKVGLRFVLSWCCSVGTLAASPQVQRLSSWRGTQAVPGSLAASAHLTRAQAWSRLCIPAFPLQQQQCPRLPALVKGAIFPHNDLCQPLLILIPCRAGAGVGSG